MWAVNLTATPALALQSRAGYAIADRLFSFPLLPLKEKHWNINFWHNPDCQQMLLLSNCVIYAKPKLQMQAFWALQTRTRPTPKLGTQAPPDPGGLPDLFITSRSASVVHPPCALLVFHPLQLFPWTFESCDTTSSEVPTPWFPSSDEISCYQQKENIC